MLLEVRGQMIHKPGFIVKFKRNGLVCSQEKVKTEAERSLCSIIVQAGCSFSPRSRVRDQIIIESSSPFLGNPDKPE